MSLPSYLEPTATVGAGVLILHQGHVLLVQMNYGSFKGHWVQPGGKVEPDEHPEQAAVREVREETGLDVEVTDMIGVRHRIRPENQPPDVYYLFRAKIKGIDIEQSQLPHFPKLAWPSDELIEARFWKIEDALQLQELRPLTRLAIEWGRSINPGRILPALLPAGMDDISAFVASPA
jgi:8-oxo-dGTP pyrophosphatase MutT (NUDIX family)